MMFNVSFVSEKGSWIASAMLHFLPRIGEEVNLAGDHVVVVNVIYDIRRGTYSGQDVNIIVRYKQERSKGK